MDFSFSETQEEIKGLAARITSERSTLERLKQLEAAAEWDRDLWSELAKAGLLGLSLPEDVGGAGLGVMEAAIVAQEVGRTTAIVPFLATVGLAAPAIAERGTAEQRKSLLPGIIDGTTVLSAALDPGAFTADGKDALTGSLPGIPFASDATTFVVAAGGELYLVDAAGPGVTVEPGRSTHRHPNGQLTLRSAPVERLGDGAPAATGDGTAATFARRHGLAIVCATACGVFEEALKITAGYISQREQFNKPIATFQGATLRAADAYIDLQATTVTTWTAIWKLATGRPADEALAMAKFWVADGGQRVAHACQHLHGGIGVDTDYPIHRYFLWAKELEHTLGGATAQLLEIGAGLAEGSLDQKEPGPERPSERGTVA